MDRVPENRDARLASLEAWAKGQQRLAEEEQRRLWAGEIARVVAQARQRLGQQVDSLREVAAIPVVITKASDLPVDRATVFADLMVRLREYMWADPIVSECDEPTYVVKAIDLARRHRPSAPWLLYVEDDVLLGPDFGLLPGLLCEADELFPNAELVSFFSAAFADPGWTTHPMDEFGWTQCCAIRNTDYLVGFRAFVDSVVTQRAGRQWYEVADQVLRAFLAVEYDAYALWCPSLVQHADVESALGHSKNWPGRISTSYEQAYAESA